MFRSQRRRALAGALAGAAILALAGTLQAGSFRPSTTVVAPAAFASLPADWRQFNDAPVLLTRRGAQSETFATSWDYRPNSLGPAGSMPRNGILVTIVLVRRAPAGTPSDACRGTVHLPRYPLIRKLPLHLPRTTDATLEGAPGMPEYRVFGRIGESYNVDVRVDVKRRTPTTEMLRTAQRVVTALRFPRWPTNARC